VAASVVAGSAAAVGLAIFGYRELQRRRRTRLKEEQLDQWCEGGSAQEPVIECEVPISYGITGADVENDVVEVPVGLLFECDRLRNSLREHLKLEDDEAVVDTLRTAWDAEDDEAAEPPSLKLPWLDLQALAQLTYWYDRRPQSTEEAEAQAQGNSTEEVRLTQSKFGRWTKKLSREKVIYGTVALRYRTRGHLGETVFRRPAGIDVTRLSTLQRAAALCGHSALLSLVETTMEQLKPKNVARIPWEEVKRHTSKKDLWLLIDGRVYDVTPFLDLHPGGGQLIMEAAAQDATSKFEHTHAEGLRYSLRLLNQFFIGVCEGHENAPPMDPAPPSPEFLETLRSITGALHTFDEAKATGEAQGLLR
jgi:cytochrome b involved in lipid metabolism